MRDVVNGFGGNFWAGCCSSEESVLDVGASRWFFGALGCSDIIGDNLHAAESRFG